MTEQRTPSQGAEMYANSDFYIRDDTIRIEQNSAEADRAAIAFGAGLANTRVRVGLTDERLRELRTLIGAYLADKYGDANMGAALGGIEWTPLI